MRKYFIEKTPRVLALVVMVLAGLISGSRVVTLGGYDTMVYQLMYENTEASLLAFQNPDYFLLKTTERGYIFVSSVFRLLGVDFNWFLLMLGIWCAFSLYKVFSRHTVNAFLLFTIFLGKGYLYYFFTAQRQVIAMCICWLGIQYILKRKLLPFLLIVVLASLFHTSAIVFAVVYFLPKIRLSRRSVIVLFLGSLLVGVSSLGALLGGWLSGYLPSFAATKLVGYLEGEGKGVNVLNFLEIVPVFVFVLMHRKFMEERVKNFNLFFNIYLLFIFITLAFYNFDIISRVKGYYLVGYIAVISAIPYAVKNRKLGFGILIVVLLYFCAVMVRELLVFDDGEGYLPYQSFFMNYL
ncbi:EpsG family protein [Riemerella anatipestifer]|uniref:EpsG family protein n=1 Tax=Riemerella anatipestifer TaxID=34085 RepID=UPI002096FAA9|nr:EpsG family protein [Riemerella anatipestifer]